MAATRHAKTGRVYTHGTKLCLGPIKFLIYGYGPPNYPGPQSYQVRALGLPNLPAWTLGPLNLSPWGSRFSKIADYELWVPEWFESWAPQTYQIRAPSPLTYQLRALDPITHPLRSPGQQTLSAVGGDEISLHGPGCWSLFFYIYS